MLCRIISCGVWCRGCVIHIRRGAYALLVSTDRAMRRPQIVKRATVQGFTLFLCLVETEINRGVALSADLLGGLGRLMRSISLKSNLKRGFPKGARSLRQSVR